MLRRNFLLLPAGAAAAAAQDTRPIESYDDHGPLVIERPRPGRPRAGQVAVAIQPHSDDVPILAAGTFFKLMDEGAAGYFIRVTNDDMAGPGWYAETVTANERDQNALAKVFGVKRSFDLNYNNHMMDNIARAELRARFIFLFRLLKADIILTYDPWGHYEENPDHYVTSACVEAAAWMAGGAKDYPEHFAAGLAPHGVKEKYYFARFQQRVNRVVDISQWVERKIDVNLENKAQGPAGENGVRLRSRLEKEDKRLPLLSGDNASANRNYIREFVLARDRETGQRYGLAYAEQFHHIGSPQDRVEDYIRRNALPR
ncbi:MAG: PIG-L family deacetylase [Acidobacteria bacterium]|nr:PIG-L family deacetylase [Acidobacteriota bacterium]